MDVKQSFVPLAILFAGAGEAGGDVFFDPMPCGRVIVLAHWRACLRLRVQHKAGLLTGMGQYRAGATKESRFRRVEGGGTNCRAV